MDEIVEQQVTEQPEQDSEPQVLDLDSAEKFKFQGREWTPEELRNAYMMQSDYTRKTQAIAEERKYYENLQYDLEAVSKNPALAQEFKRIYPEKYHAYLNYAVRNTPQTQSQNVEQQSQGLDPKFLERFEKIERSMSSWEKEMHDKQISAIDAELDAKFKQLSEKYPMADEEAVIARAQALLSQGQNLDDKVWDNLWKSVHERYQSLAEQHYAKKVSEQKQANKMGNLS